jgi:hypothetical protein
MSPEADVPNGLSVAKGDVKSRFDIYRNNRVFSLMQNLRDGFPLLAKLLGDADFDTVAKAYAYAHPPRSPLMFAYGADLPDFMAAFEADFAPHHVPSYAAQVARLDAAFGQVACAADHMPPEAPLALDDPQTQGLNLAAGLVALAAPCPIYDLWTFLVERADPPTRLEAPQELMVYRLANYDTGIALLPHGGAAFIAALQAGETLLSAATHIDEAALSPLLTQLIQAELVLAVTQIT